MKKILSVGSRAQVLSWKHKQRHTRSGVVIRIRTEDDLRSDYGEFEDLPEVGGFDNEVMVQVKLDGKQGKVIMAPSSHVKIL